MREYCNIHLKHYCLHIFARRSLNLSLSFKTVFGIGQIVCYRNEKNFFSLFVSPVGHIAIKIFNCSHMQPNSNSASLEIT